MFNFEDLIENHLLVLVASFAFDLAPPLSIMDSRPQPPPQALQAHFRAFCFFRG